MSLFDIIKYRDVDLNDAKEIEKLPHELIDLYWKEVYKDNFDMSFDIVTKAEALAAWGRIPLDVNAVSNGLTHTTYQDQFAQKAFLAALSKYNNEPI
jgi:hypothetical protein